MQWSCCRGFGKYTFRHSGSPHSGSPHCSTELARPWICPTQLQLSLAKFRLDQRSPYLFVEFKICNYFNLQRFTLEADALVGFNFVFIRHIQLAHEKDVLVWHVLDINERVRLPVVHIHIEDYVVDGVHSDELLPVRRGWWLNCFGSCHGWYTTAARSFTITAKLSYAEVMSAYGYQNSAFFDAALFA